MVKSLRAWRDSQNKTIEEFLNVGDIVDGDMVDYFTNILPPKRWNRNFLQVGENCDSIDGRNTYLTFKKDHGKWSYCGQSYIDSTKDRSK